MTTSPATDADIRAVIEQCGYRGCLACSAAIVGIRIHTPDGGLTVTGIAAFCDDHLDGVDRADHHHLKHQATENPTVKMWTTLADAWPDPVRLIR